MAIHYERAFCTDAGVYAGINFVRRTAEVTKPDGTHVFKQENVEAPDFWSERALRTAAQKYFVRPGVSETLTEGETSVVQMCHNVASTIAESGDAQGYFDTGEARDAFEKDLLWLLIRQYGAFNSPVWFNCRRWHAYNIEGKGGNWAWDAGAGYAIKTTNAYERPQCSACFLVPVDNSIVDGENSILSHLAHEARIFKYGSGSGTNFSAIQERDSRTDSNGKASGLITFLKPSDAVAGVIKSGGTTRRAAKMICVDLDHPEIEDFIDLKMREERKALILAEHGYGKNMEDESYTTVTGQNANNSVRAPDDFFESVESDGTWDLTSRVGGRVVKTLKARDLFRRIATAAWSCADPGMHYDGAQQLWHTCKSTGPIRETNPCSEYLFLTSTACNLASLKLTAFLREDGSLNVDAFQRAIRIFIIAQDILVDLSSYPTKDIAENSHVYRTLGLGYMDLGALLMLKGLPYDSEEGRTYAAAVTSLLGATAYRVSAELAQTMGPFAGYAKNAEPMYEVMCLHHAASKKAYASASGEARELLAIATTAWADVVHAGHSTGSGFRNAQTTLLAPTGTIGYLVDAETTGVEPNLGLMLYKELAGGGTVELPNRLIGESLHRLGYTETDCEAIVAYVNEELTTEVGGQSVKYKRGSVMGAPSLKAEHCAVFDCAFPPAYAKGPFIRPEGHVLMMAAVQPFLSGAISKTVNMPRETTVEDIERIYMLGWKKGLKALAIYRDGSKGAQPVTTTLKGATAKKDSYAELKELPLDERVNKLVAEGVLPEGFGSRRKLPKKRKGYTHSLKLDGHDVYLRSGEYPDGTLGEVWIDVKHDGNTVSGLANALAKALSIGHQFGVPWKLYADKLLFSYFEPHGLVEGHETIKSANSIVDLVLRWVMVEYGGALELQHVKPELEVSPDAAFNGDGPPCTNCGFITKRNGACYRCPNCSETSGCS